MPGLIKDPGPKYDKLNMKLVIVAIVLNFIFMGLYSGKTPENSKKKQRNMASFKFLK